MSRKAARTRFVLVRTYSAGVHFGDLVSEDGSEVTLSNARRLWNWSGGRLSLNEVAIEGAKSGDRISVAVPSIKLKGAIELITCSAEGEASLRLALAYKA